MQYKKTVEVQAKQLEVVVNTTCDLCGTDIPPRQARDYCEVTLKLEEGTAYPECGNGRRTIYDCCTKCWVETIVPLFEGKPPRIEDWDY